MPWVNRTGLPEWAVKMASKQTYSRPQGDNVFSVTELVGSPLIARLWRDHGHEVETDVAHEGNRLLGNAFHFWVETHGKGPQSFHEERLNSTVTVDGKEYIVSGATDAAEDALLTDQLTLWDIKTCKSYAVIDGNAKSEWCAQVNILARLWAKHGFPVESMKILAVIKDWSETEARFKPGYPQASMVVVDVPTWSAKQTSDYVVSRIRLHVAAKEAASSADVPLCEPGRMINGKWWGGERWQREPCFAVKKEGAKRAISGGKCETRAQAEALIAEQKKPGDYIIEERPGTETRCESSLWCGVRKFCGHGREIISRQQFEREMRGGND